MAQTPSTMLALGTAAPQFRLPDVSGKCLSLKDFDSAQGLVVAFICNHCPFVKHIRPALAAFGKDCVAAGGAMVAISSNDAVRYPDDGPAKMVEEARAAAYTFPYLYDESQEVAKAYRAACTPDFFVFDRDRRLIYRGQFDDSRPGNGKPVTGDALRAALTATLAGRQVPEPQWPSVGCNIKWKPGNEPEYFAVKR